MSDNEKYAAVLYREKTVKVSLGETIADALALEKQCGGRGVCGKCRVIANGELSPLTFAEERTLSKSERSRGVRLACEARILGECSVYDIRDDRSTTDIIQLDSRAETKANLQLSGYGVAVDIGTTTIAAKLYQPNGRPCGERAMLNPQLAVGGDVITRIEAALNGGGDALADSISAAIDRLITELAEDCGIEADRISDAVIVGNTTMLYLLTRTSVLSISKAPFALERNFGRCFTARELSLASLSSSAEIYIPPCISAFVGADTVSALVSGGVIGSRDATMLVDIGTNTEMALWDGETLTVASAAAGPAFEGVGISCGMRARTGAIDKAATEGDEIVAHTVGDAEPVGICGSGLIDVTACLAELSLLDASGILTEDPIEIAGEVSLTQEDIRMLQLAKGAVYGGMLTLRKSSEVRLKKAPAVLIAGGFGSGINLRNAKRISLIPRAFDNTISVVGNAALSGAERLLFDPDSRALAARIAAEAKTVDLAQSEAFAEYFIEGMRF